MWLVYVSAKWMFITSGEHISECAYILWRNELVLKSGIHSWLNIHRHFWIVMVSSSFNYDVVGWMLPGFPTSARCRQPGCTGLDWDATPEHLKMVTIDGYNQVTTRSSWFSTQNGGPAASLAARVVCSLDLPQALENIALSERQLFVLGLESHEFCTILAPIIRSA